MAAAVSGGSLDGSGFGIANVSTLTFPLGDHAWQPACYGHAPAVTGWLELSELLPGLTLRCEVPQ